MWLFWCRRIAGKGKELTEKQLILLLKQAFNAAIRHLQILEEMGLKPVILSEQELWEDLTAKFGTDNVQLPHLLVLDETGLREEFGRANSQKSHKYYKPLTSVVADQIHATTRLIQNGIPFADRRFVCLSAPNGKRKYIGVLVLEDKPEGFLGEEGQLKYSWNILARGEVHDVEITTEVTLADQNLVRLSQQFLTRNAKSRDIQAQEKGTVEVSAQIGFENSVEAQRQLYTGDVPLNTSVVVLVYRDTLEELDEACRYLTGLVKQPARLGRELEYAWLIWLQTLGVRKEPLLSTPYYRRLLFFASELSGLCNLVQTAKADSKGIELIANESGSPIFIDFSKHKNVLVLGTTGSGKSLLVALILAECLALGMPIVIIDYPNADGTGTFGDFVLFFNGIYFDISKECNNLMQPLDVSKITNEEERKERVQAHRNDVIQIITQLVLGSNAANTLDGFLIQTIESLIALGIKAFYEDREIQERFALARKAGLGSKEWNNTPTLADLVKFYSPKYISLGENDDNAKKALNHIVLRLNYWLNSSVGQAIGKPSTFDIDSSKSKLITFALTNLQSESEAEVFALSAYLAAKRQTLSANNSVFFIDEASVLLRFMSLSILIGRLCATARKSGCRIIVAGQDISSINESVASEQIIQNMACRMIGKIVPGASQSYTEILSIPHEIISQNESFQANTSEAYTRWLLNYNNTYTHCRYYPSYPLLALTANNREEQAKRDEFKAMYPNKFEWLSKYWRHYKQQLQQGKNV